MSLATFLMAAEGEDTAGFALIGIFIFFAGPIFYAVTYGRYRNKNQRHYHERETPTQMSNLKVYDTFVMSKKRQTSSTISGANSTQVHGTLAKNS